MTSSKEKSKFAAVILDNKLRGEIDEQVSAFLKNGGQIQQVPNGASGSRAIVTRRQAELAKKTMREKKK